MVGRLKFNRQIRRFQRRGRAACWSEWRLIAATHNLLKLRRNQIATVPDEGRTDVKREARQPRT